MLSFVCIGGVTDMLSSAKIATGMIYANQYDQD